MMTFFVTFACKCSFLVIIIIIIIIVIVIVVVVVVVQFSDRFPDKDRADGLLNWSILICGCYFQIILTPYNIK